MCSGAPAVTEFSSKSDNSLIDFGHPEIAVENFSTSNTSRHPGPDLDPRHAGASSGSMGCCGCCSVRVSGQPFALDDGPSSESIKV